jgi:hypothetical protein
MIAVPSPGSLGKIPKLPGGRPRDHWDGQHLLYGQPPCAALKGGVLAHIPVIPSHWLFAVRPPVEGHCEGGASARQPCVSPLRLRQVNKVQHRVDDLVGKIGQGVDDPAVFWVNDCAGAFGGGC